MAIPWQLRYFARVQCPSCDKRLAEPESLLHGAECAGCGGRFLSSAGTAKLITEELGFDMGLLDQIVGSGHRGGRRCPGCQEELTLCSLRGVKVDLCSQREMWLDHGELTRLTGGRMKERPAHAAHMRKSKRVDFTSPSEAVLSGLWMTAGIFGLILAISAATGDNFLDRPALPFCLGALGFAAVAFYLRYNLEVFYFFDRESRQVYLQRFFFGASSQKAIASFDTFVATTSEARYHSGHRYEEGYFKYRAVAFTRTGRRIPFSDWEREELHTANAVAKDIAEIVGASYTAGELECTPQLKRAGRNFIVVPEHIGFFRRHTLGLVIAVIAMLGVFFLGWLQK